MTPSLRRALSLSLTCVSLVATLAACSLRSLDHLTMARPGDAGTAGDGGAGGSGGAGGGGGLPASGGTGGALDAGRDGITTGGSGGGGAGGAGGSAGDGGPGRPDGAPPPDVLTADGPRPEGPPADMSRPPDLPPPPPDLPPPPPDLPPAPPRVYFVVGTVPASAADQLLQRRLIDRGYEVSLVDDNNLATVDIGPASAILVSQTATTSNVGPRFRDVAKPVLICEPLLFDDMGMVSATVADNRGVAMNVTTLRIESPGHPLAAGLSGDVVVTTAAADVPWGMPNAMAVKAATIANQPALVAYFGYERGAAMPELVAPARRVALFISATSAPLLTAAGWSLFDAAVAWALGR